MEVIVNQILLLGIVIVIGAFAAWRKIITDSVRDGLAKLVFNVASPALIFSTMLETKVNWEIVINGMWITIFCYIAAFLFFVTGTLSSRLFRVKPGLDNIHIVHTMFGNTVFLGFPLIAALFPQFKESVLYAALYYFVSSSVLWTFGVMIATNVSGNFWKSIRNLVNPNTIAFCVGLLIAVLDFRLPELIVRALHDIGLATSPLSMLYIGGTLAVTPIKNLLKRIDIIGISINKLILVPVIVLLLINLCNTFLGTQISDMAKAVIVLQSGTPCMTMVVIIIKNYGGNDQAAAENLFVTTVFSLLTLPLLYFLL